MSELIQTSSPCINICVVNAETGYCLGCFRTMEEISNWARLPAHERARINEELESRREAAA